jgi:hypothetical protein
MLFGLAAAVGLLMNQNASAASFTLNFDTEFSGGQAPGGSPPWLSATFTDVTPGTVSLTLSASPPGGAGLTGTENVDGLYLNVAPAFVGNLSFSPGAPATLPSGGTFQASLRGRMPSKPMAMGCTTSCLPSGLVLGTVSGQVTHSRRQLRLPA